MFWDNFNLSLILSIFIEYLLKNSWTKTTNLGTNFTWNKKSAMEKGQIFQICSLPIRTSFPEWKWDDWKNNLIENFQWMLAKLSGFIRTNFRDTSNSTKSTNLNKLVIHAFICLKNHELLQFPFKKYIVQDFTNRKLLT